MSTLPADPTPDQPFWVFGYGSLIWNPGFCYADDGLATLHGYHRAFCIESTSYRGTPERPGIVLGLDRGGSCRGRAFHVPGDKRPEVLAYLYEREMHRNVYEPRWVNIRLGGQNHRALTFVADRRHTSYCRLPRQELVRRLRDCAGPKGPNFDYLANTTHALAELGIRDHALEKLVREVTHSRHSTT